jgi:hypothetical protein
VTIFSVDPGDMDTEMHRAALPDDDPAQLAHVEDVAEASFDWLRLRWSPALAWRPATFSQWCSDPGSA